MTTAFPLPWAGSPAGEIYANPAITQRLLDDADFDVAEWLSVQVAQEFAPHPFVFPADYFAGELAAKSSTWRPKSFSKCGDGVWDKFK